MVVSRKPFTAGGRIGAAVIGVVWLTGGAATVIEAFRQGRLLLGIPGVLAVGFGLFYTVAAWRKRPFGWHAPGERRRKEEEPGESRILK